MILTGSDSMKYAEDHGEDVMMEGSAMGMSVDEARELFAATLAEGREVSCWVDTENSWSQCAYCGAMYSRPRGEAKPWHRCPDGRVVRGGLAAKNRHEFEEE